MQILTTCGFHLGFFQRYVDTALPAEETSLPIPLTVLQPVKTKSITSEPKTIFFISVSKIFSVFIK